MHVVRFCLAQIVLALEYLHSADIVHRAVEPAHVLIYSNGYVRLGDFYLAKRLTDEMDDRKVTNTIVGHVDYLAPERFRPGYGTPVDWRNADVLGYELLTGKQPFAGAPTNSFDVVKGRIEQAEPSYPEGETGGLKLCVEFLKELLNKNFRQRLGTANEKGVRDHAFFSDLGWHRLYKQKYDSPLESYTPHSILKRTTPHVDSSADNLFEEEFKYFDYLKPVA